MTTSMRARSPLHPTEPSTDFDFEDDDFEAFARHEPRRRPTIVAVVVVGALLVGVLGYMGGRASAASPPQGCLDAIEIADRAFAQTDAALASTADAIQAVIDGELPEAAGILSRTRAAQSDLGGAWARLEAAADACRAGD